MARIIGTAGSAPPAAPKRSPRPVVQPNPDQRVPSRPAPRPPVRRPVPRGANPRIVVRPSPDAQDASRAARHPSVSFVSPDARDVAGRSSQQHAHDQAITQQVVGQARREAIYQQHRQRPSLVRSLTSSTAGKPSAHPQIAFRGKIRYGESGAKPLAPALSILNQLSRPLHGIAGAADYEVRHGGVKELFGVHAPGSAFARGQRRAAVRGLENKDQTTFSDVLRDAGWRPKGTLGKVAEGVAGLTLDVIGDPTTYAAPVIAGGARGVAEVAAKVPGAERAAEAARGSLPVRLARHVNPNIRPAGVSAEDWATVREAMRRGRAVAATGEHRARNIAQAISRKLPGGHHPQITDALENRSTEKLTGDEAKVATVLQREYDRMHAAESEKGLIGSKLDIGYSPRRPLSELEREGSKRRMSGAQLASSKMRTNRLKYAEFRGTDKDVYTENAALSYYLRGRDSAVKLGRNEVIQALHSVGRTFHPGAEIKQGEDIYKFAPRKAPVKVEGDELKSIMAGGAPPGRGEYRILNNDLMRAAAQHGPQRLEGLEDIGRMWDRQVQGRIKTILTVPNPQYHLTNLYGDLFNAYLGSSVPRLAKNMGISTRALVYKARREAAAKTLGAQVVKGGTTKIAGKRVPISELVKEAEDHGAIGQGFIGRDLAEVLDAQGKEAAEKLGEGRVARRLGRPGQAVASSRVGSKVLHPIDTIRDLGQYREDAVRLASYLGARKRGLNPDKAAAFVAKHHFDYADLTQFEKSVLRRVLPFYTFTARNTPLQVRTLLSNPGKYANLEKVREESLKASGVPKGYEGNLQYYEQQGIPIPIPGTKNLLYPKLPATDLGRLTIKDQSNYLMAMLSPVIKSPIELSQNYSFFLRKPIDELANSKGPNGETVRTLKPAPPLIVAALKASPGGAAIAKALHMKPYTDQKTGKRVIGWPATIDYVWRQTPETNLAAQAASQIPNSRGQSTKQVIAGYLTGLKTVPYSPPDVKANNAGKEYDYLQAKAKEMRHEGTAYDKAGDRTPAYQKVLDRTRAVSAVLFPPAPSSGPSVLSPQAQQMLQQVRKASSGTSRLSSGAQQILDALHKGG